jgi:acyl-CoA thioester hydrolase
MCNFLSASVEIEIPFHDVDSFNVVWHGNYYKYFEIARTAVLRSISYDIPEMIESGYGWPVIESHCRYINALIYGMKICVVATIVEYEHRLKIDYKIIDSHSEKRLAKGYTTHAAINMNDNILCLCTPEILQEKINQKLSSRN